MDITTLPLYTKVNHFTYTAHETRYISPCVNSSRMRCNVTHRYFPQINSCGISLITPNICILVTACTMAGRERDSMRAAIWMTTALPQNIGRTWANYRGTGAVKFRLQIRTEGGVVAESVGNYATKLDTDAEENDELSFGQQHTSSHMVSRNFSPWQWHGQVY